MSTEKQGNKIRITMSERRSVTIDATTWPVIARADWYNGEHEFQANTIQRIKVREHADGRRIVYGYQQAGNGGQHIGTYNPEGGYMLAADAAPEETIRAIRRVAGIIDHDALGDECIAALPPEEIDASGRVLASAIARLRALHDDVSAARFDDTTAEQQAAIERGLDLLARATRELDAMNTTNG